jgi:hypothetical protein
VLVSFAMRHKSAISDLSFGLGGSAGQVRTFASNTVHPENSLMLAEEILGPFTMNSVGEEV